MQQKLLKQLEKMEQLNLSESDETGELEEKDKSVWETLGAKIDKVMEEQYVSAQIAVFSPGDLINITLAYEHEIYLRAHSVIISALSS